MPYAVNLADWLANKEDFGLAILLRPVTPSKKTTECESGRLGGTSVIMECNDIRAAAIIEFIRKRYKKHQLRCYEGSSRTWKRI